jgi:hypothetical protein
VSFLFGKAPNPPPPPPAAPQLGSSAIMQAAAHERETLASAEGQGMGGMDVTGGKGVTNERTTRTLLGG